MNRCFRLAGVFLLLVGGAASASATKLVFSTQPTKVQAGAVLSPVVVEAKDSLGNVDPGASGTVTIALATPTTSVLSGTLTAQLVNGSATFAALWLTRSGTALRLTATAPGLTSATSAAFDAPAWVPMSEGLPLAHVGELAYSSDGATAYATAGRAFRSTDQGATWTSVLDVGNAQRVVTDPFNPATVIVVTKSDLLMSTDRGDHWTSIKSRLPGWQAASAVAFDANTAGVIYVGRYNGLPAKSTNGGATFSSVQGTGLPPLSASNYPVDMAVDGQSRLYMLMLYEGPYRSDDGGATWTAISSGFARNANGLFQCGTPQRLAADPTQPGSVYFTFATWGNPCASPVWHSTNFGATWSPTAVSGTGATLAIEPSSSALYAATASGLVRSTNGGVTLTQVASGSWSYVALSASSGNFLGVQNGVPVNSQDQGATWAPGAGISGGSISRIAAGAGSPTTVYAVSYYTGLFSSQSGSAWAQSFAAPGAILGVDPTTAGYAYLYGNNQGQEGLYGTADSGQSWSWLEHNISSFACWMSITVDPRDPATLWGGGQDCFGSKYGGVWISSDGGLSWSHLVSDPSFGYWARSVAIDGTDSSTAYFVSKFGARRLVLSSTGGPPTLTDLNPGLSGTARAVSTDPSQHGVVFASTDSGIFKSTNSGATWTLVLNRGSQYPVRFSPSNPQTAYALTFSGTYKTQNGGATWTLLSLPPGVFGADLAIAPANANELYLASESGVWASLTGGE
ncbi:sialidase family protein [Hyalangium rubrum]|uniref:Uncharacterized protein n=1 Tax=Hyalangium rubrum TaxID=3103134 RepID=A0ABU5H5P5_9BACT|nr:hypothetical protein [Hyalangium sp. s54d21]MDY7228797.1 hypothetical protein [Hyalangium sp. s54d21]